MANIYDQASLVMIPSGTKTSKIFSQKPVNGDGDFTFSRSTAATRVNADGNIEKETQNLLTYSNDFTGWGIGGTLVGGQADKDGGTSAWSFTSSSPTSGLNLNITTGGVQTFSAYVKKNATNGLRLYMFGTNNASPYFNLNTGSVTSLSNALDATIVEYNSEWWRISVTVNSTLSSIYFYCTNNSTSQAVGTITIQDAQLEQGLVARDYIETTTAAVEGGITDNVPRLDYTDSSCPALLLEPQRTNLDTQSEYIAGWSNISNVTRTANYEESPEGVDNATRLEFTANGYLYNGNSPSQVNGSTYTLSCYAKRNDSGTQNFGFFRDGSGAVDSAMALTSEWKRFEYTYTATTTSRIGLAGISGADVSVYGFQIEKDASYATSYIPTYGTSVTRNADVCDGAGNAATFNDSEGVLYADISRFDNDTSNSFTSINQNNNYSNSVSIRFRSTENLVWGMIYRNGNVEAQIQYTLSDDSQFNKIAVSYKANDFALWVNGVKVGTDTSGNTPLGLNNLSFDIGGSEFFNGKAKELIVFPTALSDSELAALTTI